MQTHLLSPLNFLTINGWVSGRDDTIDTGGGKA